MRIHLATDHAGLDFSRHLVGHLEGAGHEVVDHGPTSYDPLDDYPAFIIRAAQAVVRDQTDGVEVQAARFAPTVWGVQHHPEVDAELIGPWWNEGPCVSGDQ